MRLAGVVAVSTLGGVALALLFAWVTWNFVFGLVDRVSWASLFGFGSFSGQ